MLKRPSCKKVACHYACRQWSIHSSLLFQFIFFFFAFAFQLLHYTYFIPCYTQSNKTIIRIIRGHLELQVHRSSNVNHVCIKITNCHLCVLIWSMNIGVVHCVCCMCVCVNIYLDLDLYMAVIFIVRVQELLVFCCFFFVCFFIIAFLPLQFQGQLHNMDKTAGQCYADKTKCLHKPEERQRKKDRC